MAEGTNGEEFRAGFVTFLGRPNVGKSTLMNALVGEKVAITSDKPQTTRRAVRGIVNRARGQLVVVDTPGMHRPRTLLGRRLNDVVRDTLADVDVVAFCVPADEEIGPGDRFIAAELDGLRTNAVAVVTKSEIVSRRRVAEQLVALDAMRNWDAIVPVSAVDAIGLDALVDELIGLMPPSPPLYPHDIVTEQRLLDRIAELVREAALEGVHDELPHSIAVVVDEAHLERVDGDGAAIETPFVDSMLGGAAAGEDPGETLRCTVSLYVERESQKAIVIGKGASRIRNVRLHAQREAKRIAGRTVRLDIQVKVAKDWQRDPRLLGRLGF